LRLSDDKLSLNGEENIRTKKFGSKLRTVKSATDMAKLAVDN
jgi:hypothetical protein